MTYILLRVRANGTRATMTRKQITETIQRPLKKFTVLTHDSVQGKLAQARFRLFQWFRVTPGPAADYQNGLRQGDWIVWRDHDHCLITILDFPYCSGAVGGNK